jgi:hypothetical protein
MPDLVTCSLLMNRQVQIRIPRDQSTPCRLVKAPHPSWDFQSGKHTSINYLKERSGGCLVSVTLTPTPRDNGSRKHGLIWMSRI